VSDAASGSAAPRPATAPTVFPPTGSGGQELLILSEHFAPSTGATAQLVTDLALGLAARGHRCRVLTATSGGAVAGLEVVRLGLPRRAGAAAGAPVGVLAKAAAGLVFVLGGLGWCLLHGRRGQRLLIVSNPPFVGLVGPLLRALRGMDYVFLFQDLFPRSAALTGVLPASGPITALWRALMGWVCRCSSATVVLSDAMAERWRRELRRPLPLTVIHNWAVEMAQGTPKPANTLAREWGVADTFTVQYSGNFGRLHELLTLLEAARLLQDAPIRFLFIGGGAKQAQITAYRDAFGLDQVLVMPYQPRELLPLSLGACDLAAIGLIPGAEDTVAPSKFYGILASGRGVLLVAQRGCDLAQLVLREGCGVVVEPGEVEELARELRALAADPARVQRMGERARSLYRERFGLERSLAAYEALLT
jgi:glycosyltransferase involved in cell wall biosynthesis